MGRFRRRMVLNRCACMRIGRATQTRLNSIVDAAVKHWSDKPDFVVEYRRKVVIPKIEQYQSEKKLAEGFNPYSDVPKELENDGWAFMGLIEVTNLHHRQLVHGLLEGKSVEETFSDISRDTTLSHSYLDKLKSIYVSPAYQDSIESHPLHEKKLKKEIIDAWVEEWRRMKLSKPTERSIIADIASLLPQLSEDGLRRIQAEVNIALSVRGRKGTGGTIS